MTLVDDWKQAWKWFSVQALAILALLPIVWPTLPVQVHQWVPDAWKPWIIVALAVGGLVGRLIPQTPKT